MRIAHLNNIANVAWRLAEAQRRLGHDAVVFSLGDNPLQFPFNIQVRGASGPLRWNVAMLRRTRTLASFDVLHIHGGIWVSQLFYPFFARAFPAKVIAVHYHGSETRLGKGLHHRGVADVRFHSTPDLARWLPGSMWIPNPIDVADPPPRPDNPVPVFAHFPTVRKRKGTDRIIDLFREAFGPLASEPGEGITRLRGRDAELWVGDVMPHERVLDLMRRCDVLIDQFSEYGSYGVTAIEAMAYGKPVLGTANPEWYPDCPIVRLDSERITESIREVARDERLRHDLGRASYAYVAKVHESGTVARRVVQAYARRNPYPWEDDRPDNTPPLPEPNASKRPHPRS